MREGKRKVREKSAGAIAVQADRNRQKKKKKRIGGQFETNRTGT